MVSPQEESKLEAENDNIEPELTMLQSIGRGVIGLGLFAVITAGLIAFTQINTVDRIAEQEKRARSKALFEIVPIDKHNNDLLADAFWLKVKELGLTQLSEAFLAKTDNVAHTLILPVTAPDGYTGPIQLIVGIDLNGIVKGVRVISHKETPGLGDKIDIKKSDWIRGFEGRSLENTPSAKWKVKKDGGEFDQLTGATITPRALVSAVHKALVFFKENQTVLFEQTPASQFNDKTEG